MGHYKSNLRDLEFNLFELFGLDETLEGDNFGDMDGEVARDMLREVVRLAEGPLAESFADADRNPPVFDPETHSLKLPESFKKSYKALADGEWWRVGLDEEVGGMAAPRNLLWGINEMLLGSQPAAFMYSAGPGFANILYHNGTDEQKEWAKVAVERQWGATMVLTEPDAGSDVGAGRTKAIKQDDGSWHIEGVKRFITSAVSDDLFENIFHLVLARPEGAGPGTKGLSLFFVPSILFDFEKGELGERNGAFVTGVEHKMGLKASATCELTFGGHGVPAKGWLVGEVHKGIAQMFDVIEHARMMVGTKAIGTLSTGYLNALEYAKERVQGADLTQMTDKTAPRVTITHHPDVRRSLMMQKAYSEGLRAVYLYTAAHQDPITAKQVSDADEDIAYRVNDLLLPIVKGVGSEIAYQVLAESLQTFGGSGFLQDYPVEQYIRDAKIDSLYEGTTAIQAQDFFFRKIARDRGVALAHVAGQIKSFIDSEAGNGRLKAERALLATALEDVQAIVTSMTQHLMGAQDQPTELYKVGLASVRFLMGFGDLLIGWLLLRQSEIAIAALDNGAEGKDKAFYEGKIAVASFFAKNILPQLTATRAILTNIDNDIMELDEAAF
ncbi:acyl-CoA dehydrogenase [Rhodococcus fascians]|uniref:Broad-specificity linear acyl-CoA dehydrogenase FadE5 n=1 Tax=Rhodococcoides fascians TaxID=1828 RepID=A0A143QJD7_RHOFA|nr:MULTISPECIES: acyl-CoA dehydrogenase [Rhodococcus]MDP9636335.1 alkylation response protein AidB-like acyl-CoA dehydrogenase [Rhodococcus cercidiphylli]AMY23285.1 Acyl-CoA dehydrogenase, short-chain specific [Rhodococcus fascians]AMY52722.1 Acyl-CoA dehydrogenase, short-chain specific [Rhodococcus fascians D188]KMJ50637.1 butyryl-CoA dehydrogenase [Rhodococcus fascians]KQU29650.1 butyryl-CoA dehydrogenase [Rhodococcus sp. Leaf233]